jgi:Flp pilus assembly secretin CpaC
MATLLRACALGLGLLLTAIPVAWAADQTITLTLGVGFQLLLERPFESVLIGNPNVVDVQNLTGSSVILKPLKIGASDLIFVDEKSIAITNIRVLVRDASAI